MSGFLRRLFAGFGSAPENDNNAPTGGIPSWSKHDEDAAHERVTVTKSKLRKYRLEGKVLKVWDGPDVVLASGGCVKEAESADALKEAWERDMKRAFPMGPDYNVEYHCSVTPVDEDDESDDGEDARALAVGAAVAATTMF